MYKTIIKLFKVNQDFNKAIKAMAIFPTISTAMQKQMIGNYEGRDYLSYCGIEVTDEILKEIYTMSIETPLSFKESCYEYVRKYIK